MTGILPGYFRATAVPGRLRGRQCQLCRTPIDEAYDFCFRWRGRHSIAEYAAAHSRSLTAQTRRTLRSLMTPGSVTVLRCRRLQRCEPRAF